MTQSTSDSELLLYQTEDGRTRIECRFEGETVWLTQAMMAERACRSSSSRASPWTTSG